MIEGLRLPFRCIGEGFPKRVLPPITFSCKQLIRSKFLSVEEIDTTGSEKLCVEVGINNVDFTGSELLRLAVSVKLDIPQKNFVFMKQAITIFVNTHLLNNDGILTIATVYCVWTTR